MAPTPAATVHTVFTSECNNVQFDWFATGVFESFRTSGMRGKITRLLACSPEGLAKYKGMDIGPTFVHPNYRHNPINGDTSASYNKPASVMHFSRESNFTEDYLLFIDADMLLVRDIDPIALGAKPGTVVSEEVGYMIGSRNDMAKNFLTPEAVPLAKPVGWYHIFHRDDIRKIAPLWLEFCGKVRTMPHLYWSINGSIPKDIPTGDAYVQRGKAPWISEMYGYSFGAATAGVSHVMTHGVVQYPSNTGGHSKPHILHYGIDFNIGSDYNWNKMVYKKLDISKCQGRFFGPPPKPRNVREENCALVVNTLNTAFCGYYRTHCATPAVCPPLEQPPGGGLVPCREGAPCCEDKQTSCWAWAIDEQCEQNPGFMKTTCPRACNLCPDQTGGAATAPLTVHPSEAAAELPAPAANARRALEKRAEEPATRDAPMSQAEQLLPAADGAAVAATPAADAAATAAATPAAITPAATAAKAKLTAAAAAKAALAEAAKVMAQAAALSAAGEVAGHEMGADAPSHIEGVAPSHAKPQLAGDTAQLAPVHAQHAHAAPSNFAPVASKLHDAPALQGVTPGHVAPQPAGSSPAHAPAHIAPQMIRRAQARASFTHAPGASPQRAPDALAPGGGHAQPARRADATLEAAGSPAAELAADAGESSKETQQRRLMTLQVGFWVVVIGLFVGRFVLCRGRGRKARKDLNRAY